MLNPYITAIPGDLSKADIVVLTLLCRGKNVVEFGIGGSTILLSQIANKVITYEHDKAWVDKIRPQLDKNKCEVRPIDITDPVKALKGIGEECDVVFNDGHSNLRWVALEEFWPHVKEHMILHDTRMTYAGNCLKKFFDAFTVKNPKEGEPGFDPAKGNPGLPDNPLAGSLESIQWNWLESNMCVMKKRNCTLKYENWKVTES